MQFLIFHFQVVNSSLNHNSTTSFCQSHIHNCLESPDSVDVALSEGSSLLTHSRNRNVKSSGPTVHSVKAKRISILPTSAKLKSNDETRDESDIDETRSTSQNHHARLKEDETVTQQLLYKISFQKAAYLKQIPNI